MVNRLLIDYANAHMVYPDDMAKAMGMKYGKDFRKLMSAPFNDIDAFKFIEYVDAIAVEETKHSKRSFYEELEPEHIESALRLMDAYFNSDTERMKDFVTWLVSANREDKG